MRRWTLKILKPNVYHKYKTEFGKDFAKQYYKYSILNLLTNKQKYQDLRWNLSREYIKNNYLNILNENLEINLIPQNYSTFFFWYQGINNKTPNIIKLCLESIKKNCQNVVVIDKSNYRDYVDLPEYIIEKVNNGIIDTTHFSDILRVNLLAKHGGLWIDATMIVEKPLPSLLNNYYWTIRYPNWFNSIFIMAAAADNPLFINLRNFFNKYYKDHNLTIDYFLLDQVVSIIVDQNEQIKKMISEVAYSNPDVLNVYKQYFYRPFNEQAYFKVINNTWIYKVTYKWLPMRKRNKNNLFKYLLNKYIIK